jgi:hypothetical protein
VDAKRRELASEAAPSEAAPSEAAPSEAAPSALSEAAPRKDGRIVAAIYIRLAIAAKVRK